MSEKAKFTVIKLFFLLLYLQLNITSKLHGKLALPGVGIGVSFYQEN